MGKELPPYVVEKYDALDRERKKRKSLHGGDRRGRKKGRFRDVQTGESLRTNTTGGGLTRRVADGRTTHGALGGKGVSGTRSKKLVGRNGEFREFTAQHYLQVISLNPIEKSKLQSAGALKTGQLRPGSLPSGSYLVETARSAASLKVGGSNL